MLNCVGNFSIASFPTILNEMYQKKYDGCIE